MAIAGPAGSNSDAEDAVKGTSDKRGRTLIVPAALVVGTPTGGAVCWRLGAASRGTYTKVTQTTSTKSSTGA